MNTLNANQQAVVKTYGAFLKAGKSYGEALREAAKQAVECGALLQALAVVHAKHFGCSMTWDTLSHRASFHSGDKPTRETRNDAATKSWQRNVMPHFASVRGVTKKKTQAQQKSQAELLFAKFSAMSAAEQRLFKKMISA